ncbi:hypothetical protein [Kitasatospora sp. NPDC004272]
MTFPPQPGLENLPVVAAPAFTLLPRNALYLCGACSPQVIGGEFLVPWNGTDPPTLDQCGAALETQPDRPGYVPLRSGQTGCFADLTGAVGYFTVNSTSPLSADAVIRPG